MAIKTRIVASSGSGYELAAMLGQYLPPLLRGNFPTGNVFFVDSTKSGATNSTSFGYSPEAPLATLAYALGTTGPVTASNDDLVVVMPGHTEAVIAAATIGSGKIGVNVVGLGVGLKRPLITYTTAAAASVDITAAQQYWANIVFNPVGVAAVTAGVNVTAADVQFYKCTWIHGNVTNQAALGLLTTAAADRLTVDSCEFYGTTDAGTAAAMRIVGGNDIRIINNMIFGSYTTSKGGIDNITTAGLRWLIDNNRISNATASATVCINLVSTTTGIVSNNRLQVLTGTAPIVGAAASWLGNYYAAVIATSGTLL
jgi:hypothetical protein